MIYASPISGFSVEEEIHGADAISVGKPNIDGSRVCPSVIPCPVSNKFPRFDLGKENAFHACCRVDERGPESPHSSTNYSPRCVIAFGLVTRLATDLIARSKHRACDVSASATDLLVCEVP